MTIRCVLTKVIRTFSKWQQSLNHIYNKFYYLFKRGHKLRLEDSEDEKSFNEESVDFDVLPGPCVSNILTQEDVEDQPFIVYLSQILTLAKMHYLQNCQIKSCTEQVSVEKVVVKSALYLTWVCVKYFIK